MYLIKVTICLVKVTICIVVFWPIKLTSLPSQDDLHFFECGRTVILLVLSCSGYFFPETMGKLNQFQIILDKPGGVYHPGEVLSGHVIVDLKEELKMRGNLKHFRLSL